MHAAEQPIICKAQFINESYQNTKTKNKHLLGRLLDNATISTTEAIFLLHQENILHNIGIKLPKYSLKNEIVWF
jgi:hypothetical protein